MSYFIIDNKTEIDFNKIILGNQININNELYQFIQMKHKRKRFSLVNLFNRLIN